MHLVAVRSHFGLRLDGRNNPARASNRPGRRIIVDLASPFPLLPEMIMTMIMIVAMMRVCDTFYDHFTYGLLTSVEDDLPLF